MRRIGGQVAAQVDGAAVGEPRWAIIAHALSAPAGHGDESAFADVEASAAIVRVRLQIDALAGVAALGETGGASTLDAAGGSRTPAGQDAGNEDTQEPAPGRCLGEESG